MSSTRLILLGASNLQLGLPVLVHNLRQFRPMGGDGLEIVMAGGHGRSYGKWTRVMFRELPGIVDCGMWNYLVEASPAAELNYALLTDIGNDILYGIPVSQITAWVTAACERLASLSARMVMTRLPLASIGRLSRWQYAVMRQILFPQSKLSLAEVLDRAADLDAQLAGVMQKFNITPVLPEVTWYGWDPIHILRGVRPAAWRRIVNGWGEETFDGAWDVAPLSLERTIWQWRAAEIRHWGSLRQTAQPVYADLNVRVRLY